ncbi:MAG: DMT family transporter [Actinobacteria bacterium]|nr:DMT family transporter [Actinomycetota bacterium]
MLNASTPLFTAAIAAVVLRDRLRPVQLAGLVVGLGGVAVAAGFGLSDLRGASLAGSLASVLAGAFYGFAFTWARRHLMGVPTLVAAFGQVASAAVVLLPFAVWTSWAGTFDPTPRRVGAIVVLGVLGTGLAYVLSYGVIAELGPTRASLVTYLIPVVAVTVGVVVLGEPLRLRVLVGGALIVLGIVAVHRFRANRPGPDAVLPAAGAAGGCPGRDSNPHALAGR